MRAITLAPMILWLSIAGFVLAGRFETTVPDAGKLTERIPCPSDPAETYTLYLPSEYDRSRRWPLLLVFDPRGRGTTAASVFREAAEEFGWVIVSSDNTRSDGPWEPNRRALAALWPHVLQAYSVDQRRVYAAGFSGGATVAWVLARSGAALAGIIATGAPSPRDPEASPGRLAWFGSAGRADFNFLDARLLDDRMARAGIPHRLEFFDGPHQWMPPDVARLAIGWLEVLAMRSGLRPRDDAIATRVIASEMARAEQLEATGRLVDARRTLVTIVESYAGFEGVGAATKRIGELDKDPRLARARKEEDRIDDRERSRIVAASTVIARLRSDDPPYARQLMDMLNLTALQKTASRAGYEGESARRVLESLFVQTAMYVPEDLERDREFGRAALSLEIATAIHPDRPLVWVNLAGARAMAGSKKAAMAALAQAVALGFHDKQLLAGDERFTPIRGTPEYVRLMETIPSR